MPKTKRGKRRYALRYRILHTDPSDGHGRKWWGDEHAQEERMLVVASSPEDAWYFVLLHHDHWEKQPPRIERLLLVPRTSRRSARIDRSV
jgi:hypothetical protein